jgi:hypothetical protein
MGQLRAFALISVEVVLIGPGVCGAVLVRSAGVGEQ